MNSETLVKPSDTKKEASLGRNLGLDIVRSIAIIMVLVSHARGFFSQYFDSAKWSVFGVLGVEVFFVLSGFLIGNIIIKDTSDLKWSSLFKFYIRRWFRTLPLYYLILVFYMIVYKQFFWQHFVFLQYYNFDAYNFFTASWSLAVEEWFYLTVPFLVMFICKIFKLDYKKVLFGVCLAIMTFGLAGRIVFVLKTNAPWDYGIRVNTFLRLDGIIYGVFLAGFKTYFKDMYNYMLRFKKTIFTIGATMLLAIGLYYVYRKGAGRTISYSYFSRTYLFTIIPVSVLFLVAFFEKSEFINIKFASFKISNVFRFVSKTSYSIYLLNYDVYEFVLRHVKQTNIFMSILYCALSLTIMYIIADILYKKYEYPIMNLRDKIKFGNTQKINESIKVSG